MCVCSVVSVVCWCVDLCFERAKRCCIGEVRGQRGRSAERRGEGAESSAKKKKRKTVSAGSESQHMAAEANLSFVCVVSDLRRFSHCRSLTQDVSRARLNSRSEPSHWSNTNTAQQERKRNGHPTHKQQQRQTKGEETTHRLHTRTHTDTQYVYTHTVQAHSHNLRVSSFHLPSRVALLPPVHPSCCLFGTRSELRPALSAALNRCRLLVSENHSCVLSRAGRIFILIFIYIYIHS